MYEGARRQVASLRAGVILVRLTLRVWSLLPAVEVLTHVSFILSPTSLLFRLADPGAPSSSTKHRVEARERSLTTWAVPAWEGMRPVSDTGG